MSQSTESVPRVMPLAQGLSAALLAEHLDPDETQQMPIVVPGFEPAATGDALKDLMVRAHAAAGTIWATGLTPTYVQVHEPVTYGLPIISVYLHEDHDLMGLEAFVARYEGTLTHRDHTRPDGSVASKYSELRTMIDGFPVTVWTYRSMAQVAA